MLTQFVLMRDMKAKALGKAGPVAAMASFRAKFCLILAGLLVAGTGAFAQSEDKTLLRAREGAAALMRGQYDRAIASYDEALTAPEIADFVEASIYSDRGLAKWRMGQTKEAIDDFNQAIQLAPENATVYNNRGNALMDLGHPDEAVKDFDRAVTLSGNYGAAYNNRGNARAMLGQYSPAFHDFRKAVELMSESAVPFNGRGKAHAELKRYHAAVRDFSRAISLDAKYMAAYQNRAAANLALGKYGEAAEDATQVLESQGEQPSPELLLLRGTAFAGEKKFNQALEDLNKAAELKPDLVDTYLERGLVFIQLRRFDDAIGDFTRAIQLDPQNGKAYAMRAEARLLGKPAAASAATPEGGPDETQSNVYTALNDINQALGITPSDAVALRIRGNVYEAFTRTNEAIADYRQALAQDPFQVESREALVRLEQEVPPVPGVALGEPVDGWVVKELSPGRYMASNAKYPALKAELEMFSGGQPRILEWKLMKEPLSGIGLLRYYAGEFDDGSNASLEYVAIIDTRANKIVSIEPHSWGSEPAKWNWQTASVVVTGPDGISNEITLRPQYRPRTASPQVARDFWGFEVPRGTPRTERRRARRGGEGGGGGNPFGWLFR
ncbi:MAG: tetratricopeptide repeat protein [Alphaproteobacteria bacterium]|nr:tetratricopeptide repeat protein [Alphaproteobacteria bacterium]